MACLKEAELYTNLSRDHVNEACLSLKRFNNLLKSKPGEAVLDLGCGPGSVTALAILPSLHPQFSTLVGIDISFDMIKFAKKEWSFLDRIEFALLDVAEENIKEIKSRLPIDKYDKIYSFYALQWVTNRRQWIHNLKHLLMKGGQAYLVLVVNSGVYKVWDTLARFAKWAKFFKNVKVPLNEYQYMDDPGEVLKKSILDAGLDVVTCVTQHHKDAFASNIETDAKKIAKLRSVDPLVSLVPVNLQDEYLSDTLKLTKKMVGPNGAVDYTSVTIICQNP